MEKIKVIAATGNKNKIREFREILAPYGLEVITFADEGLEPIDVVEDGDTFEVNSLKKAQEIVTAYGIAAIADDSGLEVDVLNGAPGVYSARFSPEGTDEKNNEKLLALMENVPMKGRGAQFRCAITLMFPDRKIIKTEGVVRGKINFKKVGDGGFGYDPLFIPDGYTTTFGTFTKDEKNKISHRGRALRELVKKLIDDTKEF